MTALDWEEVKRLAADFQKAQLSSNLQTLSERNCIEILTTLTENKLLDVIFTNDGKEYVTPQHLGREIKDELYIRGGRASLVDLAHCLNVGLPRISKVVSELEKHGKGLKVVLGQLIDSVYLTKIAEEINDRLSQNGHVNVTELVLHYDLPAEFLQAFLEREIGRTIFGKQDTQDRRVFYTEDYVARNRAKVRGALSALTKPTSLSAVLGQCGIPERVFFLILDGLQRTKQVPGVVTGKQSGNNTYIPNVYSKSQNEWTENFYKQNGYLEYDTLGRLGISDPVNFIKLRFSRENIIFLKSVAVGSVITDQVDANVEEAIATGSFVDVYPLLPSVLSEEDAEILLKRSTKTAKSPVHVFARTVAVSDAFLRSLNEFLTAFAEKKAREAVASGKWIRSLARNKPKGKSAEAAMTGAAGATNESKSSSRKEERRRKATAGKAGGGSQGRETKTKSTKKKYLQGRGSSAVMEENDSDEESTRHTGTSGHAASGTDAELELVSLDELKVEINRKDENVGVVDGLAEELASYVQGKLNKHALSVANQLAQLDKTTNLNEIEERLNVLMTNIRIFERGLKYFEKEDQSALSTYLVKTLGGNFATELFRLAARQNMLQCPENLNTDGRQKLLLDLPADVKEPLSALHRAVVAANSPEDFLDSAEPAMAACCLVAKKFDKKKERSFVLAHRQALVEELNATQDSALALHLITSILFTAATQSALHMSGRHVASVLSFLQARLRSTTFATLSKYYDLVMTFLCVSNEAEKNSARQGLEDGLAEIKGLADNLRDHLANSNGSQEAKE